MKKNKKGFTLVELLAVIVILAIILVIAVPQIIKTIDSARNGAFSASAKLVATSAEKEYLARKTIGDTSFEGLDTIPCTDVVKENTNDYQSCDISFDENGKATVTLIGKGKFAGKYICNGNKTSAEVTEESCTLVALTVNPNGGTNTVEYNAKYEASSTVPLIVPTAPEGKEFDKWEVSGTGASVTGNTLTMGTTATTVTAIWKDAQVAVTPVSFANDDWSTIITVVQTAEENNTEYPTEYALGSTKEINIDINEDDIPETYVLRVANKTKCSDDWMADEQKSQTACGFVLEFVGMIATAQMNSDNTNAGGWPASEMRTYLNNTIYNKLPTELRNAIKVTYVVSSHGQSDVSGELENDNHESTDKLYLLSSQEVYGTSFSEDLYDSSNGTSRQLDYYGIVTDNTDAIKSGTTWWLRTAFTSSNNGFSYISDVGGYGAGPANNPHGVSPAFRIGLEEQSS